MHAIPYKAYASNATAVSIIEILPNILRYRLYNSIRTVGIIKTNVTPRNFPITIL